VFLSNQNIFLSQYREYRASRCWLANAPFAGADAGDTSPRFVFWHGPVPTKENGFDRDHEVRFQSGSSSLQCRVLLRCHIGGNKGGAREHGDGLRGTRSRHRLLYGLWRAKDRMASRSLRRLSCGAETAAKEPKKPIAPERQQPISFLIGK